MSKILIVLLIAGSSFAAPIAKVDKYMMAHVYADALVREFDEELYAGEDVLRSKTYKNLLKTRSYIEALGYNPNIKNKARIIQIRDAQSYNQIVREIKRQDIRVKFPSTTKAGNVVGYEFPENTWSLTFDDGPRGQRTRTIVDKLYSRGIKATFFMLTAEVKKYLSTAEYVRDAGMEIALHSYTHKSLANPTAARLQYEITQAKKDMEKLLNVKLKNFRLPYGAGTRNAATRKKIADNKLVHIFWNVDTLDWKDKDPQSVFRRTKLQMSKSSKNNGVILFHDIQKPTVVTSELVMDYMLSKDINICTVEEAINATNGEDEDCIKY